MSENLAYLAGIVDGEGYVGIKKSKPYPTLTGRTNPGYHERLQIRMVEPHALRLLVKELGGWLYLEKSSAHNGRPLYCYQASDLRASKILTTLLPYLRVKKKQAQAVLALRRNKQTAKRASRRPLRPSDVAQRESLYLRIKRLNKTGKEV